MTQLVVSGLSAGYGRLRALHDVSMTADPGRVTVVLGHNGAGKSTLIKSISGVIRPMEGSVSVDGRPIRRGDFAVVPQGIGIFPRLTIAENIRLGLISVGASAEEAEARVDETAKHLPIIKERWHERAGRLSGGQRQLVSIARALVTGAPMLLLDEPSVGLAPKLVEEMMELFATLRNEGKTIILVEQNVKQALHIADDALVIKSGRAILSGSASLVADHEDLWSLF